VGAPSLTLDSTAAYRHPIDEVLTALDGFDATHVALATGTGDPAAQKVAYEAQVRTYMTTPAFTRQMMAFAKDTLRMGDDANDPSMDQAPAFYAQVIQGMTKARAAREAMWKVRESHPHPFYWAPFVLIGDAEAPCAR